MSSSLSVMLHCCEVQGTEWYRAAASKTEEDKCCTVWSRPLHGSCSHIPPRTWAGWQEYIYAANVYGVHERAPTYTLEK